MIPKELRDKIPNLNEVVENGSKVADKYEEKPTGMFVYILLVMSVCFAIYQHFDKRELRKQIAELQKDNKYYSHRSFEVAMQNKILENTVKVQDTVIRETNNYLTDSVKIIKLKK